jgi:hypothetical protein
VCVRPHAAAYVPEMVLCRVLVEQPRPYVAARELMQEFPRPEHEGWSPQIASASATGWPLQGLLEIKKTHRPQGRPVLLGIALRYDPRRMRVLNFE